MQRPTVLKSPLNPSHELVGRSITSWTRLVLWGLFILALYWVYGHRPLVAEPWQWADDGLFLRQAEAIEQHWAGHGAFWLGDYDGRILAKAPFLALVVAACHVLGLPFPLLEFAGFLALPWIFRRAMSPVVRLPGWAMAASMLALTAWPCLPIELRLLRTPLHMIAASLCLIAATGMVLRPHLPMRRQLPWAVLLGIAAAAGYLNREEITLVAPFIGVMAVLTFAGGWRRGRRIAAVLPLLAAMAVAAMPILTVSYWNYRDYGLFGTTMRRAPQFVRLFHLLTRLDPQDRLRYVPIRAATREKVYALSPTFARLRPMLEGKPTDHLARNPGHLSRGGFPADGREFFVTSFEWALRDSTFLAGTKNAAQAEAFFAQCSREIEAAITQGKIPAGPAGPALICPPLPGDYARIADASWRLLRSVYFLEGEKMPAAPVSSGVPADVMRMGEFCGAELAPLKAHQPPPLSGWRVGLYQGVTWIERILYTAVSLGLAGYVAWVALRQRHDRLRLLLAVIAACSLCTVLGSVVGEATLDILGWPNFLLWAPYYHYFVLSSLCFTTAFGVAVAACEVQRRAAGTGCGEGGGDASSQLRR